MEVNNNLGNLYRAALMIGRGRIKMGEIMLAGAGGYGENINKDKNNLYWAEKILDEYYRLRWGKIA